MKYLFSALLSVFACLPIALAQTNYSTNWKGQVEDRDAFNFRISLRLSSQKSLEISHASWTKVAPLSEIASKRWKADFGEGLSAEIKKSGHAYRLFIKSGVLFYHIALHKVSDGSFEGTWNIWMTPEPDPNDCYLVYEEGEDYRAIYPFFQDGRFTGTWASNYQWEENQFSFQDMKTGIAFKGKMEKGEVTLKLYLAGQVLTEIAFRPIKESFTTGNPPTQKGKQPFFKDHWGEPLANISSDFLNSMEEKIYTGELANTHSVLIARNGELLYENYFYGYDSDIFHDQRSASKSIASAMIGIAIKDAWLEGVEQKLYDFIPEEYQYTRNEQKSRINIQHLMAMSSGIDAIDFGINRNSAASEAAYQSSSDWLKTVLEAPMINEPATKANYGSANPYLLGIILEQVIDVPLEWYMDEKLFEPLGISQYIIQSDERGIPYFGGGVYLRPRDMLTFGQLYLNEGLWKGDEIFPEGWVKDSFQKYGPLLNADDKNEYGYLFWHREYKWKGKSYASIEARGAGGQYIAVIPQLAVVIAITSGNYRNGRFMLPEQIIEDYLLPAIHETAKD